MGKIEGNKGKRRKIRKTGEERRKVYGYDNQNPGKKFYFSIYVHYT